MEAEHVADRRTFSRCNGPRGTPATASVFCGNIYWTVVMSQDKLILQYLHSPNDMDQDLIAKQLLIGPLTGYI